jgi:hypothetical protein
VAIAPCAQPAGARGLRNFSASDEVSRHLRHQVAQFAIPAPGGKC